MIKKVAQNTISQIVSKALTALISIFLLSLLTNYLTIELFGLYSKIYNYLGIFAFLADMGLYTIAIREITNNEKQTGKVVGNIMSLRLLLGIVTSIIAVSVAFFLPGYDSPLALASIFIVSLFTISSLINSSMLALMQAKMKIEFSLVSITVGKLLNLGLIALIVFILFPYKTGFSYELPFLCIMLAGLAGIIVNTFLNSLYVKKICNVGFLWDFPYIKYIFKTSLPYAFALFLSVVYFKVDVILLSLLEPKEMADTSIALYSLPMKIIEVLMIIATFYLNSILPTLSRLFSEGKKEKIAELVQVSFKILLSLGMGLLVIGVLMRDTILKLIANEEYLTPNHLYSSSDAFVIVLFVVVFYFLGALGNYILIASHNEKYLLRVNIIVSLINIGGNIIFIPYFSFIGSGIVTVISQLAMVLFGFFYARKIVNIVFPYMFICMLILLSVVVYNVGNMYSFSSLFLDLFLRGGFLFGVYSLGVFFLLKSKGNWRQIVAYKK